VFVEEFNFLPPVEENRELEYDQYDEYSLLLGVWEDDDLIASCRLILPNEPLGLPTLNRMIIDSPIFRRDYPTAEISRIMIAAGHRKFKKSVKVLQLMQKKIDQLSAEHGITQCIGSVEPAFLKLLHYANLPYQPIGPLQHHIGPDRYPVILKTDYLASLQKQNR
jgi:N-acyl-L-homoserine lactone synthetase